MPNDSLKTIYGMKAKVEEEAGRERHDIQPTDHWTRLLQTSSAKKAFFPTESATECGLLVDIEPLCAGPREVKLPA